MTMTMVRKHETPSPHITNNSNYIWQLQPLDSAPLLVGVLFLFLTG